MLLISFGISKKISIVCCVFKELKSFNSKKRLVNFHFYTYDFIFYKKKSPNLVDFIVRKRFLHFPKIEKEMRDLLNVNLFISRLINQIQLLLSEILFNVGAYYS